MYQVLRILKPNLVFFVVVFQADINTNVQDETGAFYGVSSV